MARHAVERILPYSAEQLFELVGDVAHYPEFIPWISAMRVWNLRDDGGGVTTLDAEAQVGFSFLRERFSTRVRRDANTHQIDVALISGPFRRLLNRWTFEPHPIGARVRFDIDFEFRSRLLDAMLQANFGRAVNRLIACFESRAMALYPALPSVKAATCSPRETSARSARG